MNAKQIADALGVELFEDRSAAARGNAQLNLEGRTHYADPDTLRYFKAKILWGQAILGGALFAHIESMPSEGPYGPRRMRFVVHDLTGTCVHRGDLVHRSTSAARSSFWSWYNQFNYKQHFRRVLLDRIQASARSIEALSEALSEAL